MLPDVGRGVDRVNSLRVQSRCSAPCLSIALCRDCVDLGLCALESGINVARGPLCGHKCNVSYSDKPKHCGHIGTCVIHWLTQRNAARCDDDNGAFAFHQSNGAFFCILKRVACAANQIDPGL